MVTPERLPATPFQGLRRGLFRPSSWLQGKESGAGERQEVELEKIGPPASPGKGLGKVPRPCASPDSGTRVGCRG